VVALVFGGAVRADVAAGDRITEANVEQVRELISPGLEWCIRHGFPLTVGETKRIEWPRAYREATERYSGQVRLAADGVTLRDYVAGLPFPFLDPHDPQIAVKIMWNYDHNFFATDDLDARNLDPEPGATPGAPHLHRAALGRALRPGHGRRQLRRLRGAHRVDGLALPRRAGPARGGARPPLPGAVERPGRLGLRRGVGEAARARRRGRLQALAVRLRQARPLHRQGGVGQPVVGH